MRIQNMKYFLQFNLNSSFDGRDINIIIATEKNNGLIQDLDDFNWGKTISIYFRHNMIHFEEVFVDMQSSNFLLMQSC